MSKDQCDGYWIAPIVEFISKAYSNVGAMADDSAIKGGKEENQYIREALPNMQTLFRTLIRTSI